MPIYSKIMAHVGRLLFETNDALRLRRLQYDCSGVTILSDVPYLPDSSRAHLLDIIRPDNASADLPVIVNIHGGGLFASYKEVNTPFNCEWARRGYNVVSISYRRLPDTTLVHQVEDVMAALRFVSSHAEQYGLNLSRCYLIGDSAGALLSLFALSIESSVRLQQAFNIPPCSISFRAAAMISVMLDTVRTIPLSFLGKVVSNADDRGKSYLPYILHPASLLSEAQLPAIYMVTSAEDIIRRDTHKLAQLLGEKGVEHYLSDYPKQAGHKLMHVFSVQYPLWPESQEVYAGIDGFFRAH